MLESAKGSGHVYSTRAAEVFSQQRGDLFRRTDRMFAVLMGVQWLAGILAALLVSPRSWTGALSHAHIHVWTAVFLGGLLTSLPIGLALLRPGATITRHVIAICQLLTSGLLVHLSGGRIETHFHIFGSLAFLAVYRDRNVLLSAAAVIVVDHLARGLLWPESIYGVPSAPLWRSLEHSGWVFFEMIFLFVAIRQGIREMWTVADRQARAEEATQNIEEKVKERTRELEQSEARIRAILETAADGIITIDDDGVIHTFNPAAEAIFGFEASEIVGEKVSIIMPAPEGQGDGNGFLPGRDRTEAVSGGHEVVGQRKNGSTFPVDLAVSESCGGVYTGIVRDITERKAIDRMKTEFISTVSHELRTPLTSIRGSLGLLTGGIAGDLPEQGKSLLQIALNNSERLVRLVNDILDIEKIESGRMQFRMEPHDLVELVENAVESNQAFADQYDVGLEISESPERAPFVGDSDRMLQVLTNLLSNAVKFSPTGEAVTMSVRHTEERLRVEVTDRGPGIPEDFRSRIFGKFAQADSSDTRQKGGTGLGLSISKAIVEKHGGRIGFETAPGEGTTFFFEVPGVQVLDLPARFDPLDSAGHGAPATGPRVLVCEDDPDISKLLGMMLEQRGFVVDHASDPTEARERLATRKYEAMTLDLMLPGVSGLEFFRELRRNESTRDLPIVVVSAMAAQGREEVSGDALGVVDWLDKPIDEDRLIATVSSAAGSKATSRRGDVRRVLHVEDDSDLAQVVREILEPIVEVVLVNNLASACETLAQDDFDLVLLDLDLPDGSGLGLVPHLTQRAEPLPIVIFSAAEVETEVSASVSAALVKSRTSNEELARTIDSVIQSTTSTRS